MWLFHGFISLFVMSIYPMQCRMCDKESICACYVINDEIHADCSHMNLTDAPKFLPKVSHINLSFNKLSIFPNHERLPSELKFLDISNNNISSIEKNDMKELKNLISLNMRENHISLGSNVMQPDIFDSFVELQVLNIKKTINPENATYPVALSKLIHLKELLIDGLNNAVFDKEFSHLIHLSTVDMSGITGNCQMTVITKQTFLNLPFLQTLDLSRCKIKTIHENAFSHRFLSALDISYNMELSFRVLRNISIPSLEILKVNKIHCIFGPGTTLTTTDAINLPAMPLKELYIDSNRLEMCEPGVVKSFPKSLQKLSMADNKLTLGEYAFEVMTMVSLTWFNGSMQYRSKNPAEYSSVCSDGTGMMFEEISGFNSLLDFKQLKLDLVSISMYFQGSTYFNFPLPQHLETVFFNSSDLKYSIPMVRTYPNQLTSIYVQDNFLYAWIGPVYGLEKLRILDLSNNFCSEVSDVFFDEVPSLEVLILQGNYLGNSLAADLDGNIFKNLRNLSELYLGSNKIHSLHKNILKNAYSLRYLDLTGNLIQTWEVQIINFKNLLFLDLSNNEIAHLSSMSMSYLNEAFLSNMSVNLMYNPLQCVCQSLSFIEWILRYNSSFYLFANYSCASDLSEERIINLRDMHKYIDIHKYHCNSYQQKTEYGSPLSWIAPLMSFGISTLVCMAIIYAYRKYKHYFWYHFFKIKMKYKNYIPLENDDDSNFEYDAYVSFASDEDPTIEEINFVNEDMIEHLEHKVKLELCLPERNFRPGKTIYQCITESIIKSRLFVIVLSPQYLKSKLCEFERNMALMASLDGRNDPKMIHIIYFRKVDEMPLELKRIKRQYTKTNFLKYPDTKEERPKFWTQLHERMTLTK